MMHTRRMRRMPRLSPALCTLLAQRGKVILLIALLLILIGGFPVPAQAASPITFTGDELLGKPTDDSITVNIVPDSTIEYHYQYGVSSGTYTGQTLNATAAGGQPHETVISGLAPNTKYYYRMRYHAPGGAGDDWVVRGEHSFWTQRTPGSAFKFTVTSDSHHQMNDAHQKAMTNVYNDEPDFHVDLGDTFYVDNTSSQAAVNSRYLDYRDPLYLGGIGHSVPIFLSSGNHEEEEGWNFDDTPFSIALASVQARKAYYPTPVDDDFYSGNLDPLAAIDETTYGDEFRENYYAWEWGDALFVVIDPFHYTMELPYAPGTAGEGSNDTWTGNQWSWSLGKQQFDWFKETIENSNAKYKFVFSHQMVGGIPRGITANTAGYVRGGAEAAAYFEWGGNNADGTWGFDTQRPGWGGVPIHQLMVENGVSAYFHGHDHQYVYETRDGVVYQEVPSPSMTGSGFDGIYTAETTEEYETLAMYPNSGHLRVTVAPDQATVDYVRSNQTGVSYSYTILPNEVNEDPPGVVIVDGAASSGTADGVSVMTFAHTTGTGTDRLTLVGVSANSYNAAQTISSITFTPDGGAAIALDPVGQVENEEGRLAAIYSLINPPSGTSGIVTVTFSGSVGNGMVAGATNFAGVDQSDPFDDFVSATGTDAAPTVNVTTADQNELVFDTVFLGAATIGTLATGSGQSEQWNATIDRVRGSASTEQAAAGSVTMSWTVAGGATSRFWAIAAVPINPAAAGATHTLTVAIDPAGGGTTTPAVGSHTYAEGSVVPVTATAAAGYAFDHWSGDCTGSGTCQVTMTADKTVTAHFTQTTTPGAVTLDGAASSGTGNTIDAVSFAHTTGTGDNRLTLVGVSWNSGTTDRTISSVTFSYGGGPTVLTLEEVRTEKAGTNLRYAAIYSLLNPPSGQAGTMTVTFSGSVSNGIVAGAANFAGVDQTTPLGTENGANGSSKSPSVTLTGLGGDELVFDTVFQGGSSSSQTVTPDAGQTQLWTDFVGNARGAASTEQAASDSVTMSWTAVDSSVWAMAAVPIKPAAAGTTYNLTVAVDPAGGGTTTPAVGSHTYAEDTVVDVTATPEPGYQFTGWSGDCTGTGACSVTMDADKTVTAHFVAEQYTLTVNIVGNGSVSKDPNQATYLYGTEVNLTANPDSGWLFSGWSGDLSGAANPDTLVMNGDKTVTATFVEQPADVVIVDGAASSGTADGVSVMTFAHTTGTGADRLTLVGVSANSYNGARTISSVTFTPDGGSAIALSLVGNVENEAGRLAAIYSLLDPPSGKSGIVTVTFSGNVANGMAAGAANFAGVDQEEPFDDFVSAVGTEADPLTVDVTTAGQNELVFDTVFLGAATIGTLATGSGQSEQWNATVDRVRGSASTKQAAGGSVTMSWTVTGGATERFWAIAAVPINPAPAGATYDLTVAIDPAGGGTTNPAVGVHPYAEGSVVPVTATAAAGYAFDHWSGDCTGTGACQVTMNASKSVTAHFVQIMHDLTVAVDPAGGGTTNPAVGAHSYAEGSVVPVTATAAAGYLFDHWSGDCTGSGACQVTMTADRSVTAHFARILGDVNLDGEVDSGDALIILSCDAGINTSGYCPMNCGDVNSDGFINSTDALVILTYDAEIAVPYPVGGPGCPASVTPCPGCGTP